MYLNTLLVESILFDAHDASTVDKHVNLGCGSQNISGSSPNRRMICHVSTWTKVVLIVDLTFFLSSNTGFNLGFGSERDQNVIGRGCSQVGSHLAANTWLARSSNDEKVLPVTCEEKALTTYSLVVVPSNVIVSKLETWMSGLDEICKSAEWD